MLEKVFSYAGRYKKLAYAAIVVLLASTIVSVIPYYHLPPECYFLEKQAFFAAKVEVRKDLQQFQGAGRYFQKGNAW